MPIKILFQPILVNIALWTGNHYVVVADADDKRIHVLDPARGSMNYSYNEFQSGWYQKGRKDGVVMVVDKRQVL